NRKHFGALVLAQYVNGELQYIGHTGTGFNYGSLNQLWQKMQPLITLTSPFKEKIKVNSPVTWLKPELVCQVHFTEETEGGMLRHPVFLGLKTDKKSKEVQKANEEPIKFHEKKNNKGGITKEVPEDDKAVIEDNKAVII